MMSFFKKMCLDAKLYVNFWLKKEKGLLPQLYNVATLTHIG